MKKCNMIRSTLVLLLILCTLMSVFFSGCNLQTNDPDQNTTESTGDTTGSTDGTPDTPVKPEPPLDVKEPEPDSEDPMLHLYIAPDGDDSNDGRSEATALKSLDGASKMLVASPFAGNITIHVAEGEYLIEADAYWKYANPGYSIIVEGAGQDKTLFYGPIGKDVTFLQVTSCNDTSFSFKNFTVRQFRNGIIMRCSSNGSVQTQEGVYGWFENVTFKELGGYYTRCESSAVAGIQFLGSCNNTIKNCVFDGLRDYTTGNNIHAVYISSFSSNNLIQGCTFEDIRPDPIRIRRASSNNIIEHNTFRNTGVVAYVSDWCAGEAEPEPSVGNIVRYNQFYSGYNGIQIANVCIFKPGTNTPSPLDSTRLHDLGNTVHPSEFNPVVNVSVKNYKVSVDGKLLDQVMPVYSMDRYENYVDLDDLAVLLKGTAFAFNHTINEDEDGNIIQTINIALNNSHKGTSFTVQEDVEEGVIQANQAKGWSITNMKLSKGALYERNGKFFMSLDNMRELLALSDQTLFRYEYQDDTLCITTIFEYADVPKTIPVYMLKLPGSFTELGANAGEYSLADLKNFDVITMKTKDLDHLIRFQDLVRDGVDFVVVGIPIGDGTWGIREWRNSAMQDYYYYGTDKLTGLSRSWVTSSGGYANCFYKEKEDLIFYTIIPVGQKPEKNPQYRIAENWTTGSIPSYTEIFITDLDKYEPIGDTTKVQVQSTAATVEGAAKGNVSVMTSALDRTYLNLNDFALLLKNSAHGFTYTVDTDKDQIQVTKGGAFTGSSFAAVSNGTITATDWRTMAVQVGSTTANVSAFCYNGAWYVQADQFSEALGIYCNAENTGVKILLDLTLPEKMDVLMLNLSGNLENASATEIQKHEIDVTKASFTKVATSTELLSQYIKLLDLKKEGFQYVIVGVELKSGIWGVREFKNNAASSYYTYADRKWGTGSGGFSDWFYNGSESTIYYMVLPVGASSNSNPQLRIKQGWEKGSPVGYAQIIFNNCANFAN